MFTPHIQIAYTGSAPAIVSLSGEHDLSTSAELDLALHHAVMAGCGVIVDLSDATFIDSAILRALFNARKDTDASGKHGLAVVARPSTAPARLFDLVSADEVLAIFRSRDDALATYTAPPSV